MPRKSKPAARLDELVPFAHELAGLAAKVVLPYYRTPLAVENKAEAAGAMHYDPVTAADKAVEEAIREQVASRYPEHGMIGEEFGNSNPEADYQWVVDPIDGTRSFVMGLPTWGTLIGLTHKGRAVLGVMSQPFTQELFWSTAGGARYRHAFGEGDLVTRACPDLGNAVLACTHPSLFKAAGELERYRRIEERVRLARYGGDCYAYCLLAAGHIDLVVEASLQPFDVVALVPIIERAGGVITTWDGGPAEAGGQIVAAGDARLHEAALDLLGR